MYGQQNRFNVLVLSAAILFSGLLFVLGVSLATSRAVRAADPARTEPQQWEYLKAEPGVLGIVINDYLEVITNYEVMSEFINDLGQQGWELVNVAYYETSTGYSGTVHEAYYFKRLVGPSYPTPKPYSTWAPPPPPDTPTPWPTRTLAPTQIPATAAIGPDVRDAAEAVDLMMAEDGGLEWAFTANAGDRIYAWIDTDQNPSMDLELVLKAPDGTILASDDDGGPGLNPQIEGVTLPVNGTYLFHIRSHRGAGPFTLHLANMRQHTS